jgi:hypothetical protein
LLKAKGVSFRLAVASDDSAEVYLNGKLVSKDEGDHEFSYWNQEEAVPPGVLRPGRNVLAVRVSNGEGSSDLYLDAALTAQLPTPAAPAKK